MRCIYKYTIPPQDKFNLELPKGAQILSFQEQDDKLCLWALVNPVAAKVVRYFHIFGTGNVIDACIDVLQYIGSVQQSIYVWHLFEEYKYINKLHPLLLSQKVQVGNYVYDSEYSYLVAAPFKEVSSGLRQVVLWSHVLGYTICMEDDFNANFKGIGQNI